MCDVEWYQLVLEPGPGEAQGLSVQQDHLHPATMSTSEDAGPQVHSGVVGVTYIVSSAMVLDFSCPESEDLWTYQNQYQWQGSRNG